MAGRYSLSRRNRALIFHKEPESGDWLRSQACLSRPLGLRSLYPLLQSVTLASAFDRDFLALIFRDRVPSRLLARPIGILVNGNPMGFAVNRDPALHQRHL